VNHAIIQAFVYFAFRNDGHSLFADVASGEMTSLKRLFGTLLDGPWVPFTVMGFHESVQPA
jgi:hypothetical protein